MNLFRKMVVNFKVTGVVLIIFITTIYSTCNKGVICGGEAIYSFNINATIHPDEDSIRIGDTLKLEIETPSVLQDVTTGEKVDFAGAKNLGTLITILKFSSGTNVEGAIKKFQLSAIEGSSLNGSSDPASNIECFLFEENSILKLKLLVIPKDTGRFVLTISNAANVYRSNDVCTKADFQIDFQNTDQHFYLLYLWRPDLILDALGKPKVYYFKVY